MKRLRVYVDTSVIGGCFDPEFERWSNALFGDFGARRFAPVVSELVAAEVEAAPAQVREKLAELVELEAEVLELGPEALDLANEYAVHQVLSERFRNDMLHIALATVAEVDVLVSWNFKHIVRLDKIRLFSAVNLGQGYRPLQIYSPMEVASHAD